MEPYVLVLAVIGIAILMAGGIRFLQWKLGVKPEAKTQSKDNDITFGAS